MMSALEIEFLKFAMDGAFICSNSTCVFVWEDFIAKDQQKAEINNI